MSNRIESPVVGTVWKIEAEVGASVANGDVVLILESMKMEIPVEAEADGIIASIAVAEGDTVAESDLLATLS